MIKLKCRYIDDDEIEHNTELEVNNLDEIIHADIDQTFDIKFIVNQKEESWQVLKCSLDRFSIISTED